MKNRHIGSSFDDFLSEEGIREVVEAEAIKRVIAAEIAEAMDSLGISKTEMATRMHTSRAVVNRLLDQSDTGVTLATLTKAGLALGRKFKFALAS